MGSNLNCTDEWWVKYSINIKGPYLKPKKVLEELNKGKILPTDRKSWYWFYNLIQRRESQPLSRMVFSNLPKQLVNNVNFFDELVYEARYDSMISWLKDKRLNRKMRSYMLDQLLCIYEPTYRNNRLINQIKEEYKVG